MVAAEKAADQAGHSYAAMMEMAGRAVAEAIMSRSSVAGQRILILVGPGNNGGDGLVAGRILAEAGADVAFYLTKPRDLQRDANFRMVQEMGLFVVEAAFDQRFRVLRTRLAISDVVVDALLGTGVSRPIGGELAKLMQQVAAGLQERRMAMSVDTPLTRVGGIKPQTIEMKRPFIAAVDCPSGLNCDTGALDPLAIPADLTVTFAGPKHGHFLFPGAEAAGALEVADIGIDASLPAVVDVDMELVTAELAQSLLPERPLNGHKGTFGTAVIAAGSQHYWGAPVLAAKGAARAGAGLVALAVPANLQPMAAGQIPEATYPLMPDAQILGKDSAQQLLASILPRAQALLVGPGLSQADAFMQALLASKDTLPPLVVDADGLNILARHADWHEMLPTNTILTPHPGEMARLVGLPLAELRTMNRLLLAQQYAAVWGHVVLLKGAYTVVAAPDGRCLVLPFANPALGTGGSGDVLAGAIVALLAQGVPPFAAAVLGGWLHGVAGQLYGRTVGLLAHEIADNIPQAWDLLKETAG
ncbi:MAG: bifunctional ADP-dependent NAD(P)H-hydrate dehydratase/NAD(P)H-hydrate epimerase [Candidatus Promineifilaceae bacterium]